MELKELISMFRTHLADKIRALTPQTSSAEYLEIAKALKEISELNKEFQNQ